MGEQGKERKTSRSQRGKEAPELPVQQDKSMYLRRKTSQQVRRSYSGSKFLMAGLQVLGRLTVLVLVVTFVASLFVYAYTSDKFALKTVTFHGCSRLDTMALESVIRKEFPSHLLRIDLKQLRERLERETWALRVEIRRVLPSDLVIYVRERTPSVILEMHGELMLADENGVLLDRYEPKYGKLDVPVFKGLLGDNPEGYRMYQEENLDRIGLGLRLLSDLDSGSPAFTRSISEVDLSDKTDVRILLVDDTAEILLGDKDFLKRFRTLMANMNQYRELKAQYNEIEAVDLRFDGQIVYRPKKPVAAQPSTVQTGQKQ